jgi:hypothetical protein
MKDQYLQEFSASGISPEVRDLNFKEVEGDAIYQHLAIGAIDRRNDGRIRQGLLDAYKHCTQGGWFCGGVNLTTFEDNEWGCFKPEFPRYDGYGTKFIKYEHPKGYPTDVFALKVGTEAIQLINERYKSEFEPDKFWEQVIANKKVPIIITEGAKKAASLLSHGYIAIALPGIWSGYRRELKTTHGLIPSLVELAGRKILFAFDQDGKAETRFKVDKAMAVTTTAFNRFGCECFSLKWPDTFKGVDDFLVANGGLAFEEIIKQATLVKTEKKALEEIVLALFEKGLSRVKLYSDIASIASANNQTFKVVRDLYDEIEKEDDLRESRIGLFEELLDLISVDSTRLDLARYLPESLANPLSQIANAMGSTPEAMLFTLLPVVAASVNPDFELVLWETTNFCAKPIFWTGLIGESGNGKTPTMNTILNPYRRYQFNEEEKYRSLVSDYETELSAWKKLPKSQRDETDEPTPPRSPREYFMQDYTSEALVKVQTDQPDSGLLIPLDELAALLKGQNAYRGGKGSDGEKLLSARTGEPIKVNRADGKRMCSTRSTFSIVGGIQPSILRSQMGNGEDASGHFGRFAWCQLPLLPCRKKDAPVIPDVSELLYWLYGKLMEPMGRRLRMSPEADALYTDYHDALDHKRLTEASPAMRVVYAKSKQQVGEIALLLHLIWAAYNQEDPGDYISIETMDRAIEISKFSISQIRSFHSKSNESSLTPILTYIIEYSKRKGIISARDIVHSGKKESPDVLREYFKELAIMGLGFTTGNGKTLRYSFDPIKESVVGFGGQLNEACGVGSNLQNIDTASNSVMNDSTGESVGSNSNSEKKELYNPVYNSVYTENLSEPKTDPTDPTTDLVEAETVTQQVIDESVETPQATPQVPHKSHAPEFKNGDVVTCNIYPSQELYIGNIKGDMALCMGDNGFMEDIKLSDLALVPSS